MPLAEIERTHSSDEESHLVQKFISDHLPTARRYHPGVSHVSAERFVDMNVLGIDMQGGRVSKTTD
jgi:hypothetical protein